MATWKQKIGGVVLGQSNLPVGVATGTGATTGTQTNFPTHQNVTPSVIDLTTMNPVEVILPGGQRVRAYPADVTIRAEIGETITIDVKLVQTSAPLPAPTTVVQSNDKSDNDAVHKTEDVHRRRIRRNKPPTLRGQRDTENVESL